MKKIILNIGIGLLISTLLIAAIFYFFIFLNPIGILESNRLKWIPVLITILSIYISGRINKNTPLLALPILLIPLLLFKPFNYLYFPFALIVLVLSILMLVITRAEQRGRNKNLSWIGTGLIFLYFLFSQPMILAKPGFSYDENGDLLNANVIWDFSSKEHLVLPNHLLLDQEEKDFSLEDLKEKIYFVTFWATWCAPCMEEKPALLQLKKRLAQHSAIEFVDISFDTNRDKWKEYLELKSPEGLQLLSKDNQVTCRELGFAGIPMHFIVEEDGQYRKIRSFEMAKDKILREAGL